MTRNVLPCLGLAAFLTAGVLAQTSPAPRSITTPEKAFGHQVGADYQMINYVADDRLLADAGQGVRPHETGRHRPDG